MFIEGININGKLTTNIFDRKAPLKLYYIFGWGKLTWNTWVSIYSLDKGSHFYFLLLFFPVYPLVLVTVWATMMSFNHEAYCWSGYSAMNELWIITAPIIFALIVSKMFAYNFIANMYTVHATFCHFLNCCFFPKKNRSTSYSYLIFSE